MKRLALILLGLLVTGLAHAQVVPAPQGTAAMVCANNTVVPTPTNGKFFYVQCDASGKLITNAASGGTPSGPAGGDLGGTYPNPTALKTNGVTFGSGATAANGQYPAVGDGSTATSGNVGYDGNTISNTFGNLTVQPTVQAIVTKSLPAGDWEVSGWIQYSPQSTTNISYVQSSINSGTGCSTPAINSNTSFAQPYIGASGGVVNGGVNFTSTLSPTRFHFSTTTTVCITSLANFSASTLAATAKLYINQAR